MTAVLPFVIKFLRTGAVPRMPFLTEAERDSFLESWAGVRENLGEPLPVEGADYRLEGTCRFCGRPIARSESSGLWWATDDVPVGDAPDCAHEPHDG